MFNALFKRRWASRVRSDHKWFRVGLSLVFSRGRYAFAVRVAVLTLRGFRFGSQSTVERFGFAQMKIISD